MLTAVNDLDPEGPRSQASTAYEAIRAGILCGKYAPGKKLKIQDLANELAVSPGAVREALSRLVSEQLVVSRDQRGFAVAPLSVADLQDLTDLRVEIEAMALRRSVERGDLDWEARLIAAAHRLKNTPIKSTDDDGVNLDWVSAHSEFHAALIAACGSRRLLALHSQLYEQSERYRAATVNLESSRDVAAEHQMIVDLAIERDTEKLIEVVTEHLKTTTNLILESAAGSDSYKSI